VRSITGILIPGAASLHLICQEETVAQTFQFATSGCGEVFGQVYPLRLGFGHLLVPEVVGFRIDASQTSPYLLLNGDAGEKSSVNC
jgi:hypothetical protein